VLILVLWSGCRIPELSTDPSPGGENYRSVMIRVKAVMEKGTEKTKILLGFNDRGDRLIFLGALNQVLFEILVQGNHSRVIVSKRKEYWDGEFSEFLSGLWGIDLTYNEIKALLLEQRVNARKLNRNGFRMQIIESEAQKTPVQINLTGRELRLEFRIYEIRDKEGKIEFKKDLKNYSEVSLERLVRGD